MIRKNLCPANCALSELCSWLAQALADAGLGPVFARIFFKDPRPFIWQEGKTHSVSILITSGGFLTRNCVVEKADLVLKVEYH